MSGRNLVFMLIVNCVPNVFFFLFCIVIVIVFPCIMFVSVFALIQVMKHMEL